MCGWLFSRVSENRWSPATVSDTKARSRSAAPVVVYAIYAHLECSLRRPQAPATRELQETIGSFISQLWQNHHVEIVQGQCLIIYWKDLKFVTSEQRIIYYIQKITRFI